jgi:DivIVA protein
MPSRRGLGRRLTVFSMVAAAAGCVAVSGVSGADAPRSGVFYVSASGDDRARGTAPTHAWRTIARVNGTRFAPGTRILFEGGHSFSGTLFLDRQDRGTRSKPILIGSYGKGVATIVGTSTGILARDTSGIRIDRLRIVGAKGASGSGIDFVNDLPGNVKLPFVRISRVDVSGFGQWGVFVEGTRGDSGFSDVRITRVVAHDNVLGGIGTQGVFNQGYAHRQVYVGNSEAYDNPGDPKNPRHTGDGIVLADLDGGTIEHSIAHGNGRLADGSHGGPVGIWAWDANHVVIQHNESYGNRSHSKDGGGFDLDGGVRNSVLQDNYSHDNHGPGYLALQFSSAVQYKRGYENDIIRRNISVNDARGYGDGAIWVASGAINHLSLYGNKILVTKRAGPAVAAIAVSPVPQEDVPPTTTGVDIHHNVLEAADGALLLFVTGRHKGLRISGNDYFPRNAPFAVSWNGKTYRTLAAWRSATGQEQAGGRLTGQVADRNIDFSALGEQVAARAGAHLGTVAEPTSAGGGSGSHDYLVWGAFLAAVGVLALVVYRFRHAATRTRTFRRDRSGGPADAGAEQPARGGGLKIKRRHRGHDPRTVDRLVDQASDVNQALTDEKNALAERVGALERELEEYRGEDTRRARALASAEQISVERLEQAKQRAGELIQAAEEERDRLHVEIERLESMREELISSYRAFVLVAIELLQEHDTEREKAPEPSQVH